MKSKTYDKNKLFFTADLHFFHTNIIEFCDRPFKTVEEMNQTLIDNWNSVVKNADDTVIIDGDFAFTGNIHTIKNLLSQLNGEKILIKGNHCIQNKFDRESIKALFNGNVYDQLEIRVKDENVYSGEQRIFNSHYPSFIWPGSHNGSFHCFGHVHTRINNSGSDADLMKRYYEFGLKSYDVGVDNNAFKPISYLDLRKKLIGY